MSILRNLNKKILHKYIYEDWNIGIADQDDELEVRNVRWMKHSYKDRWFADPFLFEENERTYIILAEECRHGCKGRLVRLTVDKKNFQLVENEVILDLSTHLSFPNILEVEGTRYIYPENSTAGNTKYYNYGSALKLAGTLSDVGLADPVIVPHNDDFYLLATLPEQCNGNILTVFKSKDPLGNYKIIQEIKFSDNIARRAGNVFEYKGELISPAQVCNSAYGEGVSLQKLTFNTNGINLREIKRMMPPTREYPEGFHTFNVFRDSQNNPKVIIDGYRFGSPWLHNLYFKLRR